MDVIDIANERADLFLNVSLQAARHGTDNLPPIGHCYNCLEPVPAGACFCDCDCRDDLAKRKRCEALR